MKRIMTLALAAIAMAACGNRLDVSSIPDADQSQIAHVEPLSWWTGMTTPLQIMVNGQGVGHSNVDITGGAGVKVTATHKAESDNYLFVDVQISSSAKPGDYYLVFSNGDQSYKVRYELAARRQGSAERQSFTTADAIYLIMPDRFANGDPTNDETDDTTEGPARERLFGRHGGDIQGIIDHLDYIADLGVTAIWNTPLLEDNVRRQSYHGYACTDYYHIDSRFGSNELYRELVKKGHEKGIKMIMDVVTNHCGDTHWWIQDLPFQDWIHQWPSYTKSNYLFSLQNDPNAATSDSEVMVSGWFDRSMADMNLDNPYLLKYFQQWAVWWVEWADLDGFRVDTYPYNEKLPMAEWCKAVRAEYPDINIVGEVWTGNVPQLAYWQSGNPNKDGFDSNLPSIMDFPLQSAMCHGVASDRDGMYRVYDAISNDLYYHDLDKMLIFPSNHDIERVGDVIGRNPGRQKIVMTLTATLRGIPQFFCGDEMMFTSADLSQGHGGLRVDFPGGWDGDAFNLFTAEGRASCNVAFDGSEIETGVYADVYDYCRKLFTWRKTATAVHNGKTLHFLTRDNTYAFFRYNDMQTVFVYVNNTADTKKIPWDSYAEFAKGPVSGTDVITGAKVTLDSSAEVAPYSCLVVDIR